MWRIICLLAITVFHIGQCDSSWDHLVYAQQWPETACLDAAKSHQHKCAIADNITTWVVHGLWPSRGATHGPSCCNKTYKFNFDELKPFYSSLLKYWPNLFTDEPMDSFWEHEWDKHGTCALTLPATKGEYNYFNMGLKLNRQFDILSLLEAKGIKPDATKAYNYSDFMNAMEKGIGAPLKIECHYDKSTKQIQYIQQVEVCLDKTFKPIPCPKKNQMISSHGKYVGNIEQGYSNFIGCIPGVDIIYPPIKHPY